jgi:hypothetical protein
MNGNEESIFFEVIGTLNELDSIINDVSLL